MKKSRLFTAIVSVLALLAVSIIPATLAEAAENDLMMSAVVDGDTVSVDIEADFSFAAMTFVVKYDPSRLSFDSNVFDDRLAGIMCSLNPDYSADSVKLSFLAPANIERGALCRIGFKVKSNVSGTAVFSAEECVAAKEDETVINVNTLSAEAEVTSGVSPRSSRGSGSGSGGASGIKVTAEPAAAATAEPAQTAGTASVPTAAPEPSAAAHVFADVAPTDWYYESVGYVYEHSLMTGVSENEFAPSAEVSRAMLAVVLYRLSGEQASAEAIFEDVGETWYTDAVNWAYERGIVKGVTERTFMPNANITREQLAAMLYRYAALTGDAATVELTDFSDAGEVSEYAVTALGWAVSEGIITGMDNRTLAPRKSATRAELAAILERYIKQK